MFLFCFRPSEHPKRPAREKLVDRVQDDALLQEPTAKKLEARGSFPIASIEPQCISREQANEATSATMSRRLEHAQRDEISHFQPNESATRPPADTDVHALCFSVLSQSPSLVSIFSDTPTGYVVYQNLRSEKYYGLLVEDHDSSFTRILSRLFTFDKSDSDVDFDAVMSHIETNGFWTGSIKVPKSIRTHKPAVQSIMPPAHIEVDVPPYLEISPLVPLDLDQISTSFRRAPQRVKSFLIPSIQTMLSKTIGSTSISSSKNVISQSVTNLLASKDDAKDDESTPPRLPSQCLNSIPERSGREGSLHVWEEVDDQGLISAYASVHKTNAETMDKPFQWHDITIRRIQHPRTGAPLTLITQNDVTIRVAMEKSMLNCASTQLNMVLSIFPLHVVEYFNQKTTRSFSGNKPDIGNLARSHRDVTILFMDIVGFTSMSKEVEPRVVMKFLNDLFGSFDTSIEEYKVQKVETAGDCYIVAAGVLADGPDGFSEVLATHDPRESASRVLSFAQLMLKQSRMMRMPNNREPVVIRIGVHTGDCVSGLVGNKLHKFGLFGDSMNTASRMESTCQPGKIQISSSTYSMLTERQRGSFQATGGVEVKGKGIMETYLCIETPFMARTSSTLPEEATTELPDLVHRNGTDLTLERNASADSQSTFPDIPPIDILSSMVSRPSQQISPFQAMTRACRDAVDLLSSIAESSGRSGPLTFKLPSLTYLNTNS